MKQRPSNGDPDGPRNLRWQRLPTRRAVWWAAASTIPLAVMLAGGGVILWAVYHDIRSPSVMSFGVTLFVHDFAGSAISLGVWLASGKHLGPGDRP